MQNKKRIRGCRETTSFIVIYPWGAKSDDMDGMIFVAKRRRNEKI